MFCCRYKVSNEKILVMSIEPTQRYQFYHHRKQHFQNSNLLVKDLQYLGRPIAVRPFIRNGIFSKVLR